jgi:hypothetical protein
VRYSEELYDSHNNPASSSETRILSGKSRATVGDAIISGVPIFGLPNIGNRVGCIFNKALSASQLKSIRAKIVRPREVTKVSRRLKVSENKYALFILVIPTSVSDKSCHPQFPRTDSYCY